jgi:hypothetical protein
MLMLFFLNGIRFKRLHCVRPGEEISGSEASGSEELDDGDEEGGEAGEGRRRRRGREESSHSLTSPSHTCGLGLKLKGTGVMHE